MNTYEQASYNRSNMRDKYENRKTVDKRELAQTIVDQVNARHFNASRFSDSRSEYNGGVKTPDLLDLLFMLGSYQGFNSRMWRAFTAIPGWYELIKTVHAYDAEHGTRHYSRFLDGLERTNKTLCYYGGSISFEPTSAEHHRAMRFYNRYCAALGL